MSRNTVAEIEQLLTEALAPESLHVEDESWKHAGHQGVKEHGGGHYVVRIQATALAGMNRMQCHRLIYRTLDALFPKKIHALTIHIENPK